MSTEFNELISSDDEDAHVKLDQATAEQCLAVLERRSKYLKEKGLNVRSFFFGVTNVLVVTWCYGAVPEHFWIVYIVETLILFPLRYRNMVRAKPLSLVYYWFDFCWIANFAINIGLVVCSIDALFSRPLTGFFKLLDSDSFRRSLFCTFFGIATGPFLCSVGALGNALIFHDVENTVSVFIHLVPALLAYTLRFHSAEILAAWPHLFRLDYLGDIRPWEVCVLSGIAYLAWWVCYTLWLVVQGLHLPAKGYDTVFHSMMREPNPVEQILGWSKAERMRRKKANQYPVISVLIYMLIHGIASAFSLGMSALCCCSRYFFLWTLGVMTLSAVYRGAQRYTYYILELYIGQMRSELSDILA